MTFLMPLGVGLVLASPQPAVWCIVSAFCSRPCVPVLKVFGFCSILHQDRSLFDLGARGGACLFSLARNTTCTRSVLASNLVPLFHLFMITHRITFGPEVGEV